MPQTSLRTGFTLIEIMIAISIIAVLVTVPFFAFTNLTQASRDNQRKSDVSEIQAALENYRADNGVYPDSLQNLVVEGYMAELPDDPQAGQDVPGTAGQLQYGYENNYVSEAGGQSYRITLPLEGTSTITNPDTGEEEETQYVVLNPRGAAPAPITPGQDSGPTSVPTSTLIPTVDFSPTPTSTPTPTVTPITTADCSYELGEWVFTEIAVENISEGYYQFTLSGTYPGADDCLQKPAFGETGDPNTHYAIYIQGYDLSTYETVADYSYMIGDPAVSFESITSTEIVVSSTDPAFEFTQDAEYFFEIVQCNSSTYSGGVCNDPTEHVQTEYFYSNGWTNQPPVACSVCNKGDFMFNHYFFNTFEEANTFYGGSCGGPSQNCFAPVEEPGPTVDGGNHICAAAYYRPCWIVVEEVESYLGR